VSKNITGEGRGAWPPLSIAAQNVNSLNISSSISNWELKVNTIMRTNADLILLSDLRLKCKDGFDITN
jgi:hypothetical protein